MLDSLSDLERELLALVRELDEQQRRDILRFAQALVAASRPRKTTEHILSRD